MLKITSISNELIKQVLKLQQKKYRDEEKKFLLEGFKVIKEAFDSDIEFFHLFVSEEKAFKYEFLKDKIIAVNAAVLKKLATTDTPPEAIAVGAQKKYSLSDLKNAKNIALFENIKDLGNLGTILRAACAFSIEGVILYGDTVDLYNPKCIRASVGNLWKIPVIKVKDFSQLDEHFKSFERVATLPQQKDTVFLKEFKPKNKTLIMFGAEADGLSEELKAFSTTSLTIEMNKNVESLNLSISAAVIFYKLFLL